MHLFALKWWFWLSIDYKKGSHRLYWEDPKEVNGTKIKFTGVPFYILGSKIFDCQHGKDRNAALKKRKKTAMWAGVCTIYYKISITGFKYFILLYVHISKHAQTLSLLFFLFFQDGDFTFKKNRFLAQPSKKANCPARLKLREIIIFPDYKVF